ncbi:MAG: bile acid:sodium symporter family protein [Candidatus Dadabacteria bacterium]|nr:bile acid:sodium symporter family protein [Candidatus Dadabacteria bacterium]NIS07877.1 bile acid:sodium symporter family protein [Candidatus Dadabacteria bacterium]NIV42897.1 bile acid:sodium symporter family protein [Candidatus Dadabacteria bacterium]NIX14867.1 bile acid:sodium symporter family protein [Candidatus Dadabacteria bacterium]NIY21481.1 bile acid:sodium symporter family protein [Candidatus Dadabacteria bacterium]
MNSITRINQILIKYFTLWIILFSVYSYYFPSELSKLTFLIKPALIIIMFGMGMTLTLSDFKEVILRPKEIALGTSLQFLIMPLIGFTLAKMFGLSPELAAGVVLLGACPGGTASNVIAYLAKGDVALSVSLTSVSTLLSPLLTPVMTYLFAEKFIDVPVFGLFLSAIEIVLAPVALGIIVRRLLKSKINNLTEFLPSVSAVAIIFIVGVIVAASKQSIAQLGLALGLIIVLHNSFGLAIGYTTARLLGMDSKKARTISIEVGMQNSGLGVVLAKTHFSLLAALPSALFSVWHNVTGSLLALFWATKSN